MRFRQLGLFAVEMEEGPFRVLLSRSIPVAFKDLRPSAPAPGAFRTDAWFSKATTAHLNKWLKGVRYATVPHEQIVGALDSLGVYSSKTSTPVPAPPPEAFAAMADYFAKLARQSGGER